MVQELDRNDDFFGIREATEMPLPRHMAAASTLRARITGKKHRRASEDQLIDQTTDPADHDISAKRRLANLGSELYSSNLFNPKLSGPKSEVNDEPGSVISAQFGASGTTDSEVDTSGTDYIDSIYFSDYKGIWSRKLEKVAPATADMCGTDYIDSLYFGDFLDGNKTFCTDSLESMDDETSPHNRYDDDVRDVENRRSILPNASGKSNFVTNSSESNLELAYNCSGTDYIDLQYFPGLVKAEDNPSIRHCELFHTTKSWNNTTTTEGFSKLHSEIGPNCCGTDYIDSQYFPDLVKSDGNFVFPESEYNPVGSGGLVCSDSAKMAFVECVTSELITNEEPYFRPKKQRLESQSAYSVESPTKGENDENTQPIEVAELRVSDDNGLGKIWERIEPVWKMNDELLIDLMIKRIIYEDDELIAFDKPYQMFYSRAPNDQAELLRILPELSSRLASKNGHLHIVKSIGKAVTGVILFAKNEDSEKKTKALYANGSVEQYYRVITNMAPKHPEAAISIPLVKCRLKNNNYVMLPVGGANSSSKITPFLEAYTQYRVIQHDNRNHTSYMECLVSHDVPEQIRAHLGIGIACPIVGDIKYNYSKREAGRGIPPRLSDSALQDLRITGNAFRRLPMYMHLNEVIIPTSERSSRKIHIRAPIPTFFTYTLKKLRLLRK